MVQLNFKYHIIRNFYTFGYFSSYFDHKYNIGYKIHHLFTMPNSTQVNFILKI